MGFLDFFKKDDELVTKNISRDLLTDMSDERLRAAVFAMEAELADIVRQGEVVLEEFGRRSIELPDTTLSKMIQRRHRKDDDETNRNKVADSGAADDIAKASKLGEFLKRKRDEKGFSNEDLAMAAGVDVSTMNQILGGSIERPPDERLRALARKLGTSFETLISLVPPDRRDSEDQSHGDAVRASVKPCGPQYAKVAFVGASPSVVDTIRGEPFCGPPGRTLDASYLSKIGLEREDVLLMDLVPNLLKNEEGKAREPTQEEIAEWMPWVRTQLAEYAPAQVIALGTTARNALDSLADEWLPHPVAVRAHGERYEITRKLGRVKRAINDDLALVEIQGTVVKADGEQQIVTGIVAEPDSVDTHGDKISAREIQNAAHRFLIKSRITGEQHSKPAPARVVESYLVPSDQMIEGQTVTKGTWVITMKVVDPEFWARVKKGDFTGFSLGGFAKRVPALA
jgi:uracil-DNA glycosylase family 4